MKFGNLLKGLTLAGAVAFASSAMADGVARGSVKDAPRAAPFSWTGFYLGAHVGAAMTDITVTDVNGYNTGISNTFQNSGGNKAEFFGGLTLGYNYQFQSIVLGIEGDLGWMDLNRSTQYPPYQGVANRVGDSVAGFSTDGWYGAITGRLGITVGDPKLLVYAKAGWGWVESSASFVDTNPNGIILTAGTAASKMLDGAVYGGGIEWAFNRNWSVKVEYLHFNLGTISHRATSTGAPANPNFRHDVSLDTAKLGINYRF